MKATVKKFLRCTFPILLVSLILALFSVSAFAEEADPGDTWWSLDMETGILYVDGDVPQCDYWLGYYPPWYEWREAITEVRISEGVEEIGDDGFAECSNMTKVTFPSTLKTIGEHAFVYCYELTAFSVDEKNPYFTSDDQGVLYTKDMKKLLVCPGGFTGKLVIPYGVTTLAEYAVATCEKITEIQIPNSVTRLEWGAISYCPALTHISLPDSVEFVDSAAFHECTNLKSVDLANAELIDPSFTGCVSLERITVSKDNAYMACDSQGALYSKDMTSIIRCPMGFRGSFVIPKGVEIISYEAFIECVNLTAVEIPEGVKSLQSLAFYSCSSLKNLTIPNSVRSIEDSVFAYCGALTDISLPKGLTEMGSAVFEECTSLKTVEFPDTLTAIPYDSFSGCTVLERVSLPNQLTVIESDAFSGCFSLHSIELPQTLKEIGDEAFYSCLSLKDLQLPYGLKRIGDHAFAHCRALQSLYIPESVKELGWSLLYGCESLSSLIIPSCVTDLEVFDIGGINSLKAIYLRGPAPVQEYMYLPDGVTLYYIEGQEGWTTPLWKGYNTKTWSGYWATDVKESDYFYEPVQWAMKEGITTGVGKDLFRPENTCTRAQVVTFLWRAKGCPEPTATKNPFKDISPKDYYYKAVLWAAEQGITTGVTKDRFAPEKGCTRAQIVTFLWRAEGKPQTSNIQNPFKDMEEDTYYSPAVLWAVEQRITTGKTKDRFAPEDLCTRAQVVTFLWRGKDPVSNPFAPYYSVLEDAQKKVGDEPNNGRGLLYDLDGNGTEELILTYLSDGDHCAVYTVEDGKAVPMLEDHVYMVMGEENQCALGLAEIDGQQYLYTYGENLEMEEDDAYGDLMHYSTRWKFYLPSEEGMALAIEVDREEYCALNYGRAYWDIVEELSSLRINGEEKPFEDYWGWYETVTTVASLNRESGCGYSIEDLLTVCKP